jgi:hypothetical protein
MKYMLKIFSAILVVLTIVSCDDTFDGDVIHDNIPAVPVTFDGATTVGFNPYYTVSYAGDVFSIVVTIPDNANLNIKEVSNIVAGATSLNAASLQSATGQYLTGPATVGGKTYTLSTSITEFNTKVATANKINSAPAAGALVERAFMFLLTMDDNTKIIPVQCRIRITP